MEKLEKKVENKSKSPINFLKTLVLTSTLSVGALTLTGCHDNYKHGGASGYHHHHHDLGHHSHHHSHHRRSYRR